MYLAYIDPGSGSLIIQAAIATLIALPVLLRNQLGRGVRAVRRIVDRDRGAPGGTSTSGS